MFRLLTVLVCITLASALVPFPAERLTEFQTFADDDNLNFRLPNNTRPEKYDVSLVTNIHTGNFAFTGTVVIELNVEVESTNITLHKRQLDISTVTLTNIATNVNLIIGTASFDEITDLYTIPITSPVAVNTKLRLTLAFSGTLRNDNAGFYRSSYVNAANERKLVFIY